MRLLGVELLNSIGVNVLVVIRREALYWLHWAANRTSMATAEGLRARLFFNPKVLRWLEVIPEYRNDFEDLFVRVLINKKARAGFGIGFDTTL